MGFEPTESLPSTVFKTAAFNHSATEAHIRKERPRIPPFQGAAWTLLALQGLSKAALSYLIAILPAKDSLLPLTAPQTAMLLHNELHSLLCLLMLNDANPNIWQVSFLGFFFAVLSGSNI